MGLKLLFSNVLRDDPSSLVSLIRSDSPIAPITYRYVNSSGIVEESQYTISQGSTEVPGMPLSNLKSYTRGEYARVRCSRDHVVDNPTSGSHAIFKLKIDFQLGSVYGNTFVLGPSNLDSASDEVYVSFFNEYGPLFLDYYVGHIS